MTRPALLALLLAGCAPPDPTELFYATGVTVSPDEDGVAQAFVDRIESAERTLHVALPGGEDTTISDALLAAADRGVDVEVVTDADLAASPAVSALVSGGIPVRLDDAGLTYFEFTLNADVTFTSDMTRMSDAWVIADEESAVAASSVGTLAGGSRVVFDVRGEDLMDDLLAEHNQIFGGTDATAVDAYDAPNKSITDIRWRYGTGSDADLEVWFGPQERLTKRVIDAVYGARSSVWVLTNDLENEGLSRALQEKAALGFDVRVTVGPAFGTASSGVSRIFEDQTPDVDKHRVTDPVVPTVVLVDWGDPNPATRSSRADAMVITHDLYSAARLYRGSPVETDQMIDGTMWELATSGALTPEMQALEGVWQDHLDHAEAF